MKRWHEERQVMFSRWKQEMDSHGYDWRCPPTDPSACHCARGIGAMRKIRPHGCRKTRCSLCHVPKGVYRGWKKRQKRAAIEFELSQL